MTSLRSLRTKTIDGPWRDASDEPLKARTQTVVSLAAKHAESVDLEGRFPAEAFAAIQAERLLGVMIPRELGGEGAELSDVADICYALGRSCASTGMIYAMHQATLACILRHGRGSSWHERFIEQVAADQLLLASSTTEGKGGGNIRSSAVAVERLGDSISLERAATVISYAEQADGIVTTARRDGDALASDQVLLVLAKANYTLERTVGWNTLGMRGTCSAGFTLRATAHSAQIIPETYARIHEQTMAPVANLLWASVWTGIAASAIDRARLFLRNAARQSQGTMPPGAARFATAAASFKTVVALVNAGLRRFELCALDRQAMSSMDFQTAINMLKVESSELVVAITLECLRACGLSGYRNDGDFSVSRHVRDALSSPIMINNDRILANLATAVLLAEPSATLRD